jgi:hypothetical protein
MLGDDLRHAVIRDARERGRLLRPGEELDRRHRKRQHLLVPREALHHAHPRIEVVEHRDGHPALELAGENGIGLPDRLHPLEVRERQDVREYIELERRGHALVSL